MAKSKELEIAIKIAGKLDHSLNSALKAAGKGVIGLSKTLATASVAAAGALGAITKQAINVGKEFETSMSQVSATMMIDKTTAEGAAAFSQLEEAARECGRTTAFSATEAAEGLNFLAMAGYDVESATAALPTVLNLAGAGAMELGQSAEMLAAGMASLGIEKTEENFQHFSDILAITASKAKTDVAGIGEAITTVGGTAANLKGGTEEVAAALGILADVDLTAAEGGTHLRNMILSLQNPRNSNAAAMFEKLNISAYDAQGNMRGLNEIFGDLNKSMDGMNQQQKNDVLSTIFKQTDLAAANAMLANCGDRFDELYDAALNSSEGIGAAAKMYATQMDNLEGDIDILKSGLSDLGISIYKDLQGPLREATQLGTQMVGELSEAYAEGGMEGMVGAVGNCLSEVVDVIADYVPTVMNMGITLIESFVSGILSNADKIGDTAGTILTTLLNGLFVLIPEVVLAGVDIITGLAESLAAEAPAILSNGTEAVRNFVDGITARLPEVANAAITLVRSLVQGVIANAPSLMSSAISLAGSFLSGIASMLPEIAEMGVQLIIGLTEGILSNIPLLLQTAIQLVVSLANGLLSMLPTLIQGGAQLVLSLLQGIVTMLPQIAQAAVTLIQTLVQSLVSNLPALLQTAMQMVMALIQGIVSMLPQLVAEGLQLVASLVQGIASALPAILQMGVQLILQFVTGIVGMLPQILQMGVQLIISLVQGIAQNLPTIIAAGIQLVIALVQGLISAIPQLVAAIPQIIGAIIDTLFSTDWLQVGADILGSIKDGVISMASSIGSTVKDAVLGFFGFGGDDDSSATESGASTASSYARGISSNVDAATAAAGGLSQAAFRSMDFTAATTAGAEGAAAFTSGITDGMAGFTFDTSSIGLDNAALSANMTAAGAEGAAAFTASLDSGISAATVSTSGLTVDSSGFEAAMTATGTNGTAALTSGITSSAGQVTAAAGGLADDVNGALDSGWKKAQSSALSAMTGLVNTVRSKAKEAANAVKSAFEGMTITIPKPKIPVITTTYKTENYGDGGNISLPQFSVNWNAAGGIFDQATILNTQAGLQGVGEAGPEAVLPLDTLWTEFKSILDEALAKYSGQSILEALIQKLQGIDTGRGADEGQTYELAGAGGGTFTYAPVYNLYGSAGKDEVMEADRLSQAEFNRMMRQYEKDNRRTRL